MKSLIKSAFFALFSLFISAAAMAYDVSITNPNLVPLNVTWAGYTTVVDPGKTKLFYTSLNNPLVVVAATVVPGNYHAYVKQTQWSCPTTIYSKEGPNDTDIMTLSKDYPIFQAVGQQLEAAPLVIYTYDPPPVDGNC